MACACGRWVCPACSPYRRRKLQVELVDGDPTKFITLGWNASRPESPERARQIMGEQWKLLAARIRRRWPAAKFEYGTVVERFKSGYPHFHILARAPYIPQSWLSQQWDDLVAAPVVDIRAINDQYALAKYLTKYLTKSPERIGTGKRYWFSQGYRKTAKPDPAKRRTAAPWFWDPEPIVLLIARYERTGYAVHTRAKESCTIAWGQAP